MYLAAIIDLDSRSVVVGSMTTSLKTNLIIMALSAAIRNRKPDEGLIHHSDRGVQYASEMFQEALRKGGMICSMSRKGNCWDNAVSGSFFSTIKREMIHPHGIFDSIAEVRSKVFRYIETWYNNRRKHSSIGYLSRIEFEEQNEDLSLITPA